MKISQKKKKRLFLIIYLIYLKKKKKSIYLINGDGTGGRPLPPDFKN